MRVKSTSIAPANDSSLAWRFRASRLPAHTRSWRVSAPNQLWVDPGGWLSRYVDE